MGLKESESQFIRVNGLAFGEETKGNTVQWLTRETNAHTVWRSGGWQGGHHVTHDDGREYAFSHFGVGTFEGARTYLKHMVISPAELFAEVLDLEKLGIPNPLGLIAIDENCLATTPYHGGISRLREILRGPNKKGTVGKGVGEAIRDANNPELSLRAREFSDYDKVFRKVENIQKCKLQQAKELLANHVGPIPPEAYPELEVLQNAGLVTLIAESFRYLADLVPIVGDEYLDRLLARKGTIINEVSHGVLHHPWYGFIPHVTQIDPTAQDVLATLKKHRYAGALHRVGVVRCYLTRHGAGPFVSDSPEMTRSLTETHNNVANDWLGEFKNGYYDIPALKYALAISGGRESFDGLVISYLDILSGRSQWPVCEAYEYPEKADDLDQFFYLEGNKIIGIKVHPDTRDAAHYRHQQRLTQLLFKCQPVLRTLTPGQDKDLKEVFLDYVEDKLNLPVIGTASGPMVKDRRFRRDSSLGERRG